MVFLVILQIGTCKNVVTKHTILQNTEIFVFLGSKYGLVPLHVVPGLPGTAVSCRIQMKASGKQVFLSFRSYYPLYGYNHKSQKVYFYK